jgi:hypothetical protein
MRKIIIATILSLAPAIALAAALAPSAIVANPSSYDGKTVTVSGKVTGYQVSSTPMGKAAGFQLCDSKCVVVIDKIAQSRTDGTTATVTGTFHTTFKGPRRTFNNAVVIEH